MKHEALASNGDHGKFHAIDYKSVSHLKIENETEK
jgi:hypothetical protein